jgi:hypothetical protein
MKKTITFFALALTAYGNVTLASTSKAAITSKETNNFATVSLKNTNYNDLLGTKYVSYADANLIATGLGALKKSPKTIAEIIGDDMKITEGNNPEKLSLAKKNTAKKPVSFKKQFKN